MRAETPDRILRINTVLARTGLSRPTIYRKMQNGTFLKNVQISTRCAGSRESAIDAWLGCLSICEHAPREHPGNQRCRIFGRLAPYCIEKLGCGIARVELGDRSRVSFCPSGRCGACHRDDLGHFPEVLVGCGEWNSSRAPLGPRRRRRSSLRMRLR